MTIMKVSIYRQSNNLQLTSEQKEIVYYNAIDDRQ